MRSSINVSYTRALLTTSNHFVLPCAAAFPRLFAKARPSRFSKWSMRISPDFTVFPSEAAHDSAAISSNGDPTLSSYPSEVLLGVPAPKERTFMFAAARSPVRLS